MSAEAGRPVKSGAALWAARLTAIGFIILILGGNAWLVLSLVGATIPDWLQASAVFGIGLVLCGAMGFGLDLLKRRVFGVKWLK